MDIIAFNEASTANGRIEKINANPDSTSGIVTVPKTIASGETITIPAGRVAILPNVQIDGVLNVEGEVFIPSGATLGDLDAQLGLKANVSDVNTALNLKANTADLKEIGVGQTWQDVTASRVIGATYTNSTGKPIMVSFDSYGAHTGASQGMAIAINGNVVAYTSNSFSNASLFHGYRQNLTAIVPNGAIYQYSVSTPPQSFFINELR